MTILFDTTAHLPMRAGDWEPEKVRMAVTRICADTEAARRPGGFWPVHPEDLDEPDDQASELLNLYHGAAGVVAALHLLAQAGVTAPMTDLAALVEELHAAYLAKPVATPVPVPAFLTGESGLLLASYRVAPSEAKAQRLLALVRANVGAPQGELLWGTPGTLVVASFMRAWTGDVAWDTAVQESVENVWSTWAWDADEGVHLWTQDLYGERSRFLGAAHGFAGNVRALIGAWDLLGPARQAELVARTEAVLTRYALRVAGFANWRPRVGSPDDGPAPRIQWCHGAPGIVTSLAGLPAGASARLDELLYQAGQLIWRAGPVAKGAGLCHGTAGNGYALLALHRRTGDPSWLVRARTFAMAAVAQYETRRHTSPPWCSLWTGDLGLAVYLWHCLQGEGGLPSLDVL